MNRFEKYEKKSYCPSCDSYQDGVLKKKRIKTIVRGVTVDVTIEEVYCQKCGELMTSCEIEKRNDIAVFDAYKEKIGLLTSSEIKQIRAKRGMSQEQMADFLDIGAKDITRYENGSIQTKNIDNMIKMIDDDLIFRRMCIKFNKTEYLYKGSRESFVLFFANPTPHERYGSHLGKRNYADSLIEEEETINYGTEKLPAEA